MVSFLMVHHLEYTDAGPFAEPGAHNRASFLWGGCLLLPGVGIPSGQPYLLNLRVLEDLKAGSHILC